MQTSELLALPLAEHLQAMEGLWDSLCRDAPDSVLSPAWHADVLDARAKAFNAPLLLLDDAKHSDQEPRFHALGKTDQERLLHIAFTLRDAGTKIRVISARDMHRKERVIYAQTN